MTAGGRGKQKLKVLITVKTYPIPSAKYDELVCTAGVTERGLMTVPILSWRIRLAVDGDN